MNKRLISLTMIGSTFFFGLILVGVFLYDSSIDDQKYSHNPVNISSYEINGYYKINPNSILDSLSRNESHIFLTLQGDPFTTEELSDVNISWNQADYLQIANALSLFVWKEPLDLNDKLSKHRF
jgi:hypothetical protein